MIKIPENSVHSTLLLTDMMGKIVYQEDELTMNLLKIDLTTYAKGFYNLILKDNSQQSIKIIII